MATQLELKRIAARVLPDLTPEFALSKKNLFLAGVMSTGTLEEANLVVEHYGKPAMRDILRNPPARIFDRESWNFWHAYLGLEPVPMPRSFFADYPGLRDRGSEIRQITAQMLGDMPAYGQDQAYSADEARMS